MSAIDAAVRRLADEVQHMDDGPPPWMPEDGYGPAPAPTEQPAAGRAEKAAWWIDRDNWCEADIPKRRWIAPGFYMRGAVTLLPGPPGGGKSALSLAHAVALALGRPFNRLRPQAPCRVMVLNMEDDAWEQRRRLSAVLRYAVATPSDLKDRLVRLGPERVGTLVERDAKTGCAAVTAAMAELEALLDQHRPDVLFLDPLVELHTSEESDNTGLRAVMAELRALAVEHDMALVVIHHTRKGSAGAAGDPEVARGASAIVGACRLVLTVMPMTADEAGQFGMRAEQARHYFRVDGAKSNYSALGGAEWFERVAYQLDNGDTVAAAIPWEPPQDAVSPDAVEKVLADIAAGSAEGPWSPQLTASVRSVRSLFQRHGITSKKAEVGLLNELTAKRGVTMGVFKDRFRKPVKGLRTAAGLPDSVEWE